MQAPETTNQDFNLLTLNRRKAAWLLWGYGGVVAVVALLLATQHVAAFGALFLVPIGSGILLSFRDRWLGEATRVSVSSTQLTFHILGTDEQTDWPFAQVCSYRIVPAKGGLILQLRTQAGEKWRIRITYSSETAAMLKAFERAVRQYVPANDSTLIQREKDFFERPVSTKVLGWLFAASAAIVACGLWRQVPAVVYALPVGLVLLPYVSVWAMYSDKRP